VTNNYGARLNAAVAAELRAERGAVGMTIAQVIEKSGIGKSQILRLLNNQRAIDMNDLALISHALDVEPNDIMGRAQARLNREDA